jgi:hypothetical protein
VHRLLGPAALLRRKPLAGPQQGVVQAADDDADHQVQNERDVVADAQVERVERLCQEESRSDAAEQRRHQTRPEAPVVRREHYGGQESHEARLVPKHAAQGQSNEQRRNGRENRDRVGDQPGAGSRHACRM